MEAVSGGGGFLSTPLAQLGFLGGLVVIGMVILAYVIYTPTRERVPIIEGTLNGSKSMVFHQDPALKGSKLLPRSNNEKGGAEFTYTWWMMADSFERGGGQMVFVKGYPKAGEATTTYCPMVLLRNENGDNVLDIRFNTYLNESERVTVDNIPISKWFNVALVVQRGLAQVYVNGRLAKSVSLSGVIRQNYGPLAVGPNGGFGGLISDLTYYSYAINPAEVASVAGTPPNKSVIGIDTTMPPYLAKQWFLGGGNLN